MLQYDELIHRLRKEGVIKSEKIFQAFLRVKRRDFMVPKKRDDDDRDEALPTMCGQTISQPYTVAFMLQHLDLASGQRILDVGSGSGWVTALLADIVGEGGNVYAIERHLELVEFARKNLEKYDYKNIELVFGDGSKGLRTKAPFDRIHVAASAKEVPQELKKQLARGGMMIIPTAENDIRLIEKKSDLSYSETIFPGFVFVPLVEG